MANNNGEKMPEVDRDVRADETHKHLQNMIPLNAKRTYDEYQNESLETFKLVRKQMNDVHNLTVQTMQNAIENANLAAKQFLTNADLITKQCVRHADVAIDCTWDPGPGEESLKKD